jgi:hypothetical protein
MRRDSASALVKLSGPIFARRLRNTEWPSLSPASPGGKRYDFDSKKGLKSWMSRALQNPLGRFPVGSRPDPNVEDEGLGPLHFVSHQGHVTVQGQIQR